MPGWRALIRLACCAATASSTFAVGPANAAGTTASNVEARLVARQLLVPVAGVTASELRDTYRERRGDKTHEALDIAARKGTPVLATDDGRIVKLFRSVPGGNTIYQADPDHEVVYYYAHLDRYAEGLREGDPVKRGQVIGFVGTSGNARPDAPHLHFAVYLLPPGKQWWKGTALDPLPLYRGTPVR